MLDEKQVEAAKADFRTGPYIQLAFTDISSEEMRKYIFPGGDVVLIRDPIYLSVNDNGHRIYDGYGHCHYIPKGWIHLSWMPRQGKPHFVK